MSSDRFYLFLGSKSTADGDCGHEIKKMLASWKETYDKLRQVISKGITDKVHIVKAGLSSSQLCSCDFGRP